MMEVLKRVFTLAFLSVIGLSFTPAHSNAQTISGVVFDESNYGMPGVNIHIKGSTTGTTTDVQGNFVIEATSDGVLVLSYIGYQTKEILLAEIDLTQPLRVMMSEDVAQLREVVVTAFGIEREQKALGYAIQEIQAAELDQSREINLINALAGRVAGVSVGSNNAGPATSARITIRGESSLDINKNQPLFIVDGIPITNEIVGIGGGSTNQEDLPTDYGNGAGEINPDDIESISVLKGPNAAALYGSRAANGAVIITTKQGSSRSGLGVSFNSTTTAENVLRLPDYQNAFGGGVGGQFVCDWGYNWGPALDGQSVNQDCLLDDSRRSSEEIPFVAQSNTINNFFETGTTLTNNLAIAGGNNQGAFRLSYTNLQNNGVIPNTGITRNTLSLNSSYSLSNRIQVSASGNYVRSESDNLPTTGYGNQGLMYNFIWWYRNQDIRDFQNYWSPGAEDIQQDYYFSWADNPYLIVNEHLNTLDRDRLFGNVAINIDMTTRFTLMIRSGLDYNAERRTSRRPMGSVSFRDGMYREQEVGLTERNSDFLLTYTPNFGANWGLQASVGGNTMRQDRSNNIIEGRALGVPGVYNLANIAAQPSLYQFDTQRELNSFYGLAQFNWQERIFLDITGRNDWSSTLPSHNNSYFYPSISLSAVLSELLDAPAAVSFAKIRASLAQVGNDTDPFRLTRSYSFSTLPSTVTNPALIPNPDLKPEITTSLEIGADLRFFDNRLGLDFTYYDSESQNQILEIPLSISSGFSRRVINAGKINNHGVEAVFSVTPVQNFTRRFSWDVDVNFGLNRSEVRELVDGVESFIIGFGPDGNTVQARVGGRMGDMYGRVFDRVDDPGSPHFGEIIYDNNGLPVLTEDVQKIGNYNPDWMAGLHNGLKFGNVSIDVLFDYRKGGQIYSYTLATGSEGGILEHTLPGRPGFGGILYTDSQGNAREDGIIGEGVLPNSDGTFRPNDTVVDVRSFYTSYYRRDNIESNSFDATFLKLREVKIGYRIPSRLFGTNTQIRTIKISAVGRNLMLWTDVPNIDPESFAMNGGTLVPGFEVTQLPSTRSFGVNLNIEF